MPNYHSVNDAWPEGTNDGRNLKPTAQEAITACQRLYRKFMGHAWPGKWEPVRGRIGTWCRDGVTFAVNPDERGGGWHEIVHSMSHYISNFSAYSDNPDYRTSRNVRGHHHTHAFIEREMIKHVVSSGWHLGKLRREPRPAKPPKSGLAIERERVAESILRWERKLKRAEKALVKLKTRERNIIKRQLIESLAA
jgi:hypothetical protein